jgi:hypothetical protein
LHTDRRKRPGGRFDLAAPDGTCYLAETEGVAARERCGRFIIKNMPVPPEWFEGRVVSKFAVPPPDGPVGDLTNTAAATSGVTAEIHTISDYRLTTRWAAAARRSGYGALLYQPRFTPGSEQALALFGPSGPAPHHPVQDTRPLIDVLVEHGYKAERSASPSTAALDARVNDDAEPEDA